MAWYISANVLDSMQRSVLNWLSGRRSKPNWVQGYAGSGKTILLVHAMEKILAGNPSAKIAFVCYTHALKDLVSEGIPAVLREKITITTKDEFKTRKEKFTYVFVDEVQDIPKAHLALIKQRAEILTIAGDADQRIFLDGATADEIEKELAPEIQRLFEIHRLTPAIKNLAMKIMPRAKLVEGKAVSGQRNITVRMVKFENPEDEARWMYNEALERSSPGEPSVVLVSTHKAALKFASAVAAFNSISRPPEAKTRPPSSGKSGRDYSDFNLHFEKHGVPLAFFGSGNNEYKKSHDQRMVYIVVFLSSKGLDFRQVFIPYCTSDLYLGTKEQLTSDPDLARRVLFVAVTRSRRDLFMSYSGNTPHPYLADVPSDVTQVVVASGWKAANQSGTFF